MINLTIDGIKVSAPEGATILEAARIAGIDIPTLCFLKEINENNITVLTYSKLAMLKR